MTVNQLRVFVCVARYLNYTTAANKLYMTRQAVRQNISALENELNVPLFSNSSNHISLTTAGQALLAECVPVVEAFDAMERKIFSQFKFGRSIRICISQAAVPDFLPELNRLLSEYAEKEHIQLEIISAINNDVSRLVADGKADCGVVIDMRSHAPELVRTELSSHKTTLFVANTHRFWNKTKVSIDELDGENICLPGDSVEFSTFFDKVRAKGLNAHFYYYPNYYQVYYNVRENGFIAFNRYNPAENNTPEYTRDIIFEGMPPFCGAFITKPGCSKEINALAQFLADYYHQFFAEQNYNR